MSLVWSESDLRVAKLILSKYPIYQFREALKEIQDNVDHPVTQGALRAAFQRNKLNAPSSYCKELSPSEEELLDDKEEKKAYEGDDDEPDFDPVERREQQEEISRDKRQIRQLVDQLREARARQSFIDVVHSFKAPPRIMPREKNSGVREMTAVALCSDWHVEEPVEPESVAYRNEYNLDIADHRIRRLFDGIIWNIEHHRASKRLTINDLVLWLGGDLMTGYIHEELVETNALSPTETIRWLLPRIRDGIWTLLNRLDFAHIEVPCSYGNHGRTTAKPRISSGFANSFEWLMYHSLADEFRNEKRIHFEITNSPHQYVQVYDWTLHFHHGDDVKYMGGVGGLGIPLLKSLPMWDLVKRADVHNIGHHHSLLDYGRAVVNGSLIGYGPYSQRIRAAFEVPQQAMYYMDKKRGKSMLTSLWVDEEAPNQLHGVPPQPLEDLTDR
jgi:hypothetical protein